MLSFIATKHEAETPHGTYVVMRERAGWYAGFMDGTGDALDLCANVDLEIANLRCNQHAASLARLPKTQAVPMAEIQRQYAEIGGDAGGAQTVLNLRKGTR